MNARRAFSYLMLLSLSAGCAEIIGIDDGKPVNQQGGDAGRVDAPVTPSAIGQTCMGLPGQADCPSDYTCLMLSGGTNPWCSKECSGQADPVCEAGYSGPGVVACLLNVTDQKGNPLFSACLAICNDNSGMLCDPATCDGTCPGSLVCTPNPANPSVSVCI